MINTESFSHNNIFETVNILKREFHFRIYVFVGEKKSGTNYTKPILPLI